MEILHINYNYSGDNKVHKTMLEHLSKISELENFVFAPTSTKKEKNEEPKVKVIPCFNKLDRYLYFSKERKILKQAEKYYQIDDFDIIHAYTLFVDGYVAWRLSKKYKKPYIVTIRNTDLNAFLKYKKYLKPLARRILRDAAKIIFLSNSYKNSIEMQLFNGNYLYNNKTEIIPNGVDDFWIKNIYNKNRHLSKEIRIIYVGKIEKNKNITTTQEAIKILRNKGINARFTVVGKIAEQDEFEKIAKNKDTLYLGPKDKTELLDIYRGNDIFVMVSHAESFGLVYAEAMTQGLPVIYTKGQGFDGQFKEGEIGYHASDTDANEIAKTIEKIKANYANLSQNSRSNSKQFEWTIICKQYEAEYKAIKREE